MTDKEKYKILCNSELSIPVYSRDWWLDCVCGENNWDVLLYYGKEDKIEAAMPFYMPCKGVITMPVYTQTMGIWFNPEQEDKRYSKNLYRKQLICDYFIEHLPSHHLFLQSFHYSFTDWLPFYWKDYSQTTRYNYVLPDIGNLDKLWTGLSDNIRRNIRKAKDKYKLEVKKAVPTDCFLAVNAKTYERQGIKVYQPAMLKKLIDVVRSMNRGDIWGAWDENGHLHAAAFIVWQKNCAYYIAGGFDSERGQSGTQALVLWEAIGEISKISDSFDFCGSMMTGIERFFRSFGSRQMPYYLISKGKMSLGMRVLIKIKKHIKKRY